MIRKTLAVFSFAILTFACSSDSPKSADTTAVGVVPAAEPLPDSSAQAGGAALNTAPITLPASSVGFLDPNSASATDLATLPGVTEAVAASIVAARPYSSMVAVNRALPKSLTEKQRDSVFARLWTPIDINKASGDEILLIPGIGPRMKHEFEEYRPYKSIEQFRREIGKYVDKDEVARLERYIVLN